MELNRRYKMSKEQIARALECLSKPNSTPDDRGKCYFMWKEPSCFNCYHEVAQNALSLIKELTDEKKNLEYTLVGVMHSVDKWLDGAELEKDEVNRAATMREKTLQIVEKLTEENESLKTQRRVLAVNNKDAWRIVKEVRAEGKRLRADTVREMREKLIKGAFCSACGIDYSHHIIQVAKEMLEGNDAGG